jgi:hypothetical protein
MSPRHRHLIGSVAAILAVGTAALLACSQDTGLDATGAGSGTGGGNATNACASPNDGCPCDTPGTTIDCGYIKREGEGFRTCGMGKRTCGSGKSWGACIGDQVAPKYWVQSSLRFSGLGADAGSCAGDPCNPECERIVDTPDGLDAGTGLQAQDGGLSLAPNPDASANQNTCTGLSPMANTNMVVTGISPVVTVPPTTTFSTLLTPTGCYTGPFSALWGVDRFDLGVVSTGGTYTHVVPLPGNVKVSAYAGAFRSDALVNVTVNVSTNAAAPAGYTVSNFGGALTSFLGLPQVLYPYAGTVFPQALAAPRIMWRRAAGDTTAAKAVRIALLFPATGTPTFSWQAVVPETATPGPEFPPTALASQWQAAWTAFGQAASGSTGRVVIQRIDSGDKLQASVNTDVKFATAGLRGRIYYARYGGGTGDVMRANPDGSTAPALAFGTSKCGVCHSVSADGSTFVTSREDNNLEYSVSKVLPDGSLEAFGMAPKGAGDSRGFSYAGLSADGKYVLQAANFWGNISNSKVIQGQYKVFQFPTAKPTPITGAALVTDVSNAGFGGTGNVWGLKDQIVYTPTFAPNNQQIVYVDGGTANKLRKGVAVVPFDVVNKRFDFSARRIVVDGTTGGNLQGFYTRWPIFELDSRSLLFSAAPDAQEIPNSGTWAYAAMLVSGCCGHIQVPGRLYSADSAVGGSGPVALTNVNAGLSGLGIADADRNYQPTMLNVSVGGYRWMIFTSLRQYGHRANVNTTLNGSPRPYAKLWVAAVNDTVSGTTDRSNPPFWFPSQDEAGGYLNERGYWALDACKQAGSTTTSLCAANDECCGYAPNNPTAACLIDVPVSSSPPTRHCRSTAQTTCKTIDEACTTSSDCCGFPNGPLCISGQCKLPPPVPTFAPSSFERSYEANCAPGKLLRWQFFDWQSVVPSPANGAGINFFVRAADTEAGLASATEYALANETFSTPPGVYRGADVGALLTANIRKPPHPRWIRVRMSLSPTTDNTQSPVLVNWRQNFACVDGE